MASHTVQTSFQKGKCGHCVYNMPTLMWNAMPLSKIIPGNWVDIANVLKKTLPTRLVVSTQMLLRHGWPVKTTLYNSVTIQHQPCDIWIANAIIQSNSPIKCWPSHPIPKQLIANNCLQSGLCHSHMCRLSLLLHPLELQCWCPEL